MSQESQEKPAGNTKTAGQKYQNYRYFITFPHEEPWKPEIISKHFKEIGCKKFTFQLEKGDKTGYEHWSCEVSLAHKEYRDTFKNLLGINKAHIEATKDYFAAKNYNSKEETRILGPFNEKSLFLKSITTLYPWQEKLCKELLSPCEYFSRKIIWYVDNGNTGKSEFCRYMVIQHKANLFNNSKTKDIAFAISDDPKIVLFDLSRSQEGYFNYSAIEDLKNGQIFCAKYESKLKMFNKPHVVIFANFKPDLTALTSDKWDIRST